MAIIMTSIGTDTEYWCTTLLQDMIMTIDDTASKMVKSGLFI